MAFAVIIIGYSLGRLKIFKVSLDLSGVLVVAVLAGWLLEAVKPQCISDISELSESFKPFSTIGTALFVSSIGLATGGILDYQKSKDLKAIITGSVMSVSAFAVMRLISSFDGRISESKLLGAMCGALTSTPGLSAVCELKDVIAEEAVLGYGSTYLFGVTATVLFVQVQNRQAQETCQSEQQIETTTQSKAALSGLIQIGIVVLRLGGSR